jgi:citrate lyase beta subunit
MRSLEDHERRFPGDTAERHPVHTVYGGAHLFRAETTLKLSRLAVASFERYSPAPDGLARIFGITGNLDLVWNKVKDKLESQAIEDLRIDFEDGYGIRPDSEEDGHARIAAAETFAAMEEGTLPPFFGIRVKAFTRESTGRAKRTLDVFVRELYLAAGRLPENFVVTLPKPVIPDQVAELADHLAKLENEFRLPAGTIGIEIMIETPQSIIAADGRIALPLFIDAAGGRLTAAHFGAYDYTASLGITSSDQTLDHPACDHARMMMQLAFAGTGIRISDGATNIMPIPIHRGDDLTEAQEEENRASVENAWGLHYRNCRRALSQGFYQGWDLHPAQLPARYAAMYSFFAEGADAAGARLRKFIDNAAQATLVGDVFDDAASGQGLLNYFVRAVNCGALTDAEASKLSGLSIDDLRSGSFGQILASRSGQMAE